tara:strand:+ start:404 stop:700 length:297 start_codon:yes stop_codon:yes gene_type:complete
MRIDEITINIPITIDLDGDKPRVNVAGKDAVDDDDELDQNPVMINPLQQELELKKSEQGKASPVIDKLLGDEEIGDEEIGDEEDEVEQIVNIARRLNQ